MTTEPTFDPDFPDSGRAENDHRQSKPRRWPWIVGIAAALFLTACSTTEPAGVDDGTQVSTATADVESVQPAEPTEPAADKPELKTSQRGNLIKEIGETAGMLDESGETMEDAWLQFRITDVTVDGECTEKSAEAPENGHMIFVTLEASTGSDWPADLEGLNADFTAFDFSIVGTGGLTESGLDTISTFGCLPDSELLPVDGIGPGENVTGVVVLDSANTEGVLVYKPWYGGGATGWEWEF